MEDPQHLLFMDTMERLLIQLEECDVEFCPPPVFDLPPPPPPPWLVGTDDEAALLPDCSRGFGGCSGVPTAVVSSVDNVQQIVQHISVIVVSSFIIVITVMLTAVIIWRRGRVLVRKFGSRSSVALHNHSHGSNGATSPSKHKAVAGSQRTLPNHYTTTSAGQFPIHNQHHQLGVDVNGRAVLATTIPTNNGTTSAESSSLLIGGVPFHILQRPAPPLSGSCEAGRYGSALASLYPVYETIDYSDGSEKWSVYSSDRQLSATRCSPLGLVQGPSGRPGVSSSPSTTVGTDTPTPPPLSVEEDRLRHYSQPGSEISGYLVYPVYPNNSTNALHPPSVHAQYMPEAQLVHHPTLPLQQHQFVVGGVESGGAAARVVCAPRHLPNLPSATPRRTQSHRTSASTAVPITRTPLPPIPRTMQSMISLEATSETSSSPVTQL